MHPYPDAVFKEGKMGHGSHRVISYITLKSLPPYSLEAACQVFFIKVKPIRHVFISSSYTLSSIRSCNI